MAHDHVHGSNIEQAVIMVCTPDLYYQEFKFSGPELRSWKHKFLKRLDQYYELLDKRELEIEIVGNYEDIFGEGITQRPHNNLVKDLAHRYFEDKLKASLPAQYTRYGPRTRQDKFKDIHLPVYKLKLTIDSKKPSLYNSNYKELKLKGKWFETDMIEVRLDIDEYNQTFIKTFIRKDLYESLDIDLPDEDDDKQLDLDKDNYISKGENEVLSKVLETKDDLSNEKENSIEELNL